MVKLIILVGSHSIASDPLVENLLIVSVLTLVYFDYERRAKDRRECCLQFQLPYIESTGNKISGFALATAFFFFSP